MKLLKLDPRWCIGSSPSHYSSERYGMGLSFDCPVHLNHRIAVMFANPLDGLPPCAVAHYRWQRTGETFSNLTLGPSIDASGNKADIGDNVGMIQTPCWHGFIQNGEIV